MGAYSLTVLATAFEDKVRKNFFSILLAEIYTITMKGLLILNKEAYEGA